MKKKHILSIIFCSALIIVISSCEKILPGLPDDNSVLDGQMEGLSPAQLSQFLRGDVGFNEVFSGQNGLGPVFVSTSCGLSLIHISEPTRPY